MANRQSMAAPYADGRRSERAGVKAGLSWSRPGPDRTERPHPRGGPWHDVGSSSSLSSGWVGATPRRWGVLALSPLAAAPHADAQARVIPSHPEHSLFRARFSPDDRWVVFQAPARGQPVGEPFRVTSFDNPGRMVWPSHAVEIALSTDRLFLPLTEVRGSIWVLDNVDQ